MEKKFAAGVKCSYNMAYKKYALKLIGLALAKHTIKSMIKLSIPKMIIVIMFG